MGMEEGNVRPRFYQQIRCETEGPLELLKADGEILERGTQWASVNAAMLKIEHETIEIEEFKLELQLKKSRQESEELRLRTLLEIREAEIKLAELQAAAESPDLPERMRSRAAGAITDMETQITMLRERVRADEIASKLDADRREGELQLERKRKQYEQLRRRSILTAGNRGQLRLSDELRRKIEDSTEEGDPYPWVQAGEHLATIVDDESLEIIVPATSQVMAQIPADQLMVLLQDGRTGKLIEGRYKRTEEADNGLEITRTFIFSIPGDSVQDAREATGQRQLIHIYRKFPQNYRLVYKKDIAFIAPQVLESGGWHGLARHLWPGSTVVQVGPQTLALDSANAN